MPPSWLDIDGCSQRAEDRFYLSAQVLLPYVVPKEEDKMVVDV